MPGNSDGRIELDLVVNQNGFQRQMQGIQGLAKKAGMALAAAFSVKKLIDFGASCIELGSDLQEVQNVVDVTFGSMSSKVNEFAQSAAASFGLSETMAKKFTGTFGAMAKAFGFSEDAAYEMSTSLTGLAGDVASFYNLSQEEAYTKLKSVFTGETESLKDLGVVMTQTALDSYALANGFGKTTAKMTESEKVALRYQFVQEQLSAASSDFERTSGSWANQMKVLNLQFESFKATIGQGLINAFTPVIQVVNTLLSRIMVLAEAFRSLTERIFGDRSGGDAAAQMQATAAAATDAADATESVGDAAASAGKKMSGLSGVDELLTINSGSSGGSGSAGGGAAGFDMSSPEIGQDTSALEETESRFQSLIDRARELAGLFQQGFQFGLGDTSVFDDIRQSLDSIGESFVNIFTSPEVTGAFNGFINAWVQSLGTVLGSSVSIGASIAGNLLGGISGYLESDSGRIQDYIVAMFNIGSRLSEIRGNFAAAVATIAESLRCEGAVSITESIIGAFSSAFMGVTELCGRLAVDVLDVITGPFIDNQDEIRTTLEDTFSAVAPIFATIKDVVDECVDSMQTAYDEHIGPLFTSLRDGLSEIMRTVLEAWNTHILPVIERLSEKFSEFKDQYLSPLIEKFGEFIGQVSDAINAVWTNGLQPFLENLINEWAPVIGEAIDGIGTVFMDIGAAISETVSGVLTALGGLMDFITGVFTGDWSLAWDGIKAFFSGIWEAMVGVVDELITAIWDIIMTVINVIATFIREKFNSIKQAVTESLTSIKEAVSSKFNEIKSKIQSVLTTVKTFITNIFSSIYSGISNVLNRLRTIWSNIWNGMKNTVINIFNGMWNAIKRVINSILGGVEGMANGIVRGLNRAIEALNNISFSVPNWVPEIGGMSFGFSVPSLPEISIPRLANGGYVKANTPQLAMIGDNRHQGEVVSPENKLQEMAETAAKLSRQDSGAMNSELLKRIIELLNTLIDLVADGKTLEFDGKALARTMQKLNREYQHTHGTGLLEI